MSTDRFDIDDATAAFNARVPGSKAGFVYFMLAGEFVKIGFSTDPLKRLPRVQWGCPLLVTLAAAHPAAQHVERDYHLRFASHAVPWAREWFRLEGDLAEYVAHLCRGGIPMWAENTDWQTSTGGR